MASNYSPQFKFGLTSSEYSNLEGVLKQLYKEAEDNYACGCLIIKDVRLILISYFRYNKPWLLQAELEKRTDQLIKITYDEYKKERNTALNIIRRSIRRATNKQPNCECSKTKDKSVQNTQKKKSDYSVLQTSLDSHECKCHVTCYNQYKTDILRPLQSFMAINRSFKLRLKHLDSEKYGHLDTDKPARVTKSQGKVLEKNDLVTSPTGNRSFQVKLEERSTPSSKETKYLLRFMRKSPTNITEDQPVKHGNNQSFRSDRKKSISSNDCSSNRTYFEHASKVSKGKENNACDPGEDFDNNNDCFTYYYCSQCVMFEKSRASTDGKEESSETYRTRRRSISETKTLKKNRKSPIPRKASALPDRELVDHLVESRTDQHCVVEKGIKDINLENSSLERNMQWDYADYGHQFGEYETAENIDDILKNYVAPLKADVEEAIEVCEKMKLNCDCGS